jgi:DNA-binding transcriptional MerR regulator
MKSRCPSATGREGLITTSEAATLLGVSQPTLRRCDELGKFDARRHPMNSDRMYLRDEVLTLRKKNVEGERAA